MATTTMERISALAGTRGKLPAVLAAGAAEMVATRVMSACGLVLENIRAKRDMRRLAELDDRMLRDIGISRSEIESAVYGEPRAERRCHAHV